MRVGDSHFHMLLQIDEFMLLIDHIETMNLCMCKLLRVCVHDRKVESHLFFLCFLLADFLRQKRSYRFHQLSKGSGGRVKNGVDSMGHEARE